MRAMLWLGVLCLGGCIGLQDSKSVTIPPSETPVIVTSHAEVTCTDYFFFSRCELNLTTGAHP